MKLLCTLFFSSLVLSLVIAQPTPPPPGGGTGGGGSATTSETVTLGNAVLKSTISGISEGQKISGTNVNFTANFTVALTPSMDGPPGPGDYIDARLDAFVVKVGGNTVKAWNGEMPAPGFEIPIGVAVRFQSTYFSEGNIELEGIGYFSLKAYGSTAWVPASPVTVLVNADIYNKGLTMGTKVQLPTPPGSPLIESPAGPMTSGSKLIVDEGKITLEDSEHTLLGTSNDPYYRRDALIGYLNQATAFIAATHGSTTSYSSSYGPADDGEELSFGAAFSGRAAGIPPFNLVVFYSCATLDSSGLSGGNLGFQITNGTVGRAYLGFEETISLVARKDAGGGTYTYHHISAHAGTLFEELTNGKTVGEAIVAANVFTPGRFTTPGDPDSFVTVEMEFRGDNLATLNKVYMTSGQSIPQGESTWYWAPIPGLP